MGILHTNTSKNNFACFVGRPVRVIMLSLRSGHDTIFLVLLSFYFSKHWSGSRYTFQTCSYTSLPWSFHYFIENSLGSWLSVSFKSSEILQCLVYNSSPILAPIDKVKAFLTLHLLWVILHLHVWIKCPLLRISLVTLQWMNLMFLRHWLISIHPKLKAVTTLVHTHSNRTLSHQLLQL